MICSVGCWVGGGSGDPRSEEVHDVKGLGVSVLSSTSWSAYLRGASPSPSRHREEISEVPIDAHDLHDSSL